MPNVSVVTASWNLSVSEVSKETLTMTYIYLFPVAGVSCPRVTESSFRGFSLIQEYMFKQVQRTWVCKHHHSSRLWRYTCDLQPVGLFRRVTAELMCCVWSRRLFTKSDSSSSNAGPCVLSSCVFIDSTICSCVCRFNIVLRADVCVCVWKRECVNLTAIQRRWKCLMWCCRGILLNHIYISGEKEPCHTNTFNDTQGMRVIQSLILVWSLHSQTD